MCFDPFFIFLWFSFYVHSMILYFVKGKGRGMVSLILATTFKFGKNPSVMSYSKNLESHFAKKSQINQTNRSKDPDDDMTYFPVTLPEHMRN